MERSWCHLCVCVIVREIEREKLMGFFIKSRIASKNTHELLLFEERDWSRSYINKEGWLALKERGE